MQLLSEDQTRAALKRVLEQIADVMMSWSTQQVQIYKRSQTHLDAVLQALQLSAAEHKAC